MMGANWYPFTGSVVGAGVGGWRVTHWRPKQHFFDRLMLVIIIKLEKWLLCCACLGLQVQDDTIARGMLYRSGDVATLYTL